MEKYALVTGGSEGVGFACAQMLSRHGFHVILIARDLPKLEAAKAQFGSNISIFSCDVSDRGAIMQLRNYISVITDRIDVIINAAGTFRWDPSDIDLMTLNAESKGFIVDVFKDMLPAGAWVVNVSSQAAHFGADDPRRVGEEAYVASMQRVGELTREFAAERPDVHVYVTYPPLMKGKISESQFRGRPEFADVDFDALPGPEIVAEEIEGKLF